MWTAHSECLADGRGTRTSLDMDARGATFADVVQAWQAEAGFRTWFNALLSAASYEAFRWETPAVTSATFSQPFEFVLLDEPSLARSPDRHAFAEHFATAKDGVAVFANLGGDATMIVPCPLGETTAYGHLAAFVRLAPPSQQDSLWRAVGATLARRINDRPVWLSTAGAGVSWLHVRLDDRPKYYGYRPYRLPPS
jgi:hypothetical protein